MCQELALLLQGLLLLVGGGSTLGKGVGGELVLGKETHVPSSVVIRGGVKKRKVKGERCKMQEVMWETGICLCLPYHSEVVGNSPFFLKKTLATTLM